MARLSAEPIELTHPQRQTLEAIVRKRTNPQQLVTRAKIILAGDAGEGVRETSRALGVTRKVVQSWRRRWREREDIAEVEARLADAPRPGAPATYQPEQICAIIALACEKPERQGRAVSHWTQQALADEAVTGIEFKVAMSLLGRSERAAAQVSEMSRPQIARSHICAGFDSHQHQCPKGQNSKRMHQKHGINIDQICQMLNISRATFYRYLAVVDENS